MTEADGGEPKEKKAASAARKVEMGKNRPAYVEAFVSKVSGLEGVLGVTEVETPDDFFVWVGTESQQLNELNLLVREVAKEVCLEHAL